MLYFFFPCLLAFHYWLYPVWLCMWRIIKNLEPWTNISRRLMCHERWWSFHRPWLEHPSKITPQPVKEASVVSILRQHEAPNTGPWDRSQGFFHITKARKHRRVTLIMQKGLPLGENPLVLSHHCRGLMYNRPKYITLDAAAIDLTVSETVWQWELA